jgi:hypothetical protein
MGSSSFGSSLNATALAMALLAGEGAVAVANLPAGFSFFCGSMGVAVIYNSSE